MTRRLQQRLRRQEGAAEERWLHEKVLPDAAAYAVAQGVDPDEVMQIAERLGRYWWSHGRPKQAPARVLRAAHP